VRQLTGADSGYSYCPAWSPDGARLCFASRRDGYSDLYVINADGTSEVQITAGEGVDDDWPAWSPEGGHIAFTRGDGSDDLWMLEVGSWEARPLTGGAYMDYRPTWSPDGRFLAFRRSLVERSGVYVMPAEGGDAWRITEGYDPSWSPVGNRVAHVRDDSLWTIGVTAQGQAAGDPLRLTCKRGMADSHPAWSPDATHIAFQREEVTDGATTARIMIITADGRDLRDLGDGRRPDWSPV